MKSKKMYCRIRYNKKNDSFELQTRASDDVYDDGFVISCKCQHANGQPEDNEPEMIHFSIINELNKAVKLGYIYEA